MAAEILNTLSQPPAKVAEVAVYSQGVTRAGADARKPVGVEKDTLQNGYATDLFPAQAKKAMDTQSLRELVDQANRLMDVQQRKLAFSVYEETGTQMIQVFDRETEKLIRQYPPDEYLDVAKQIQELLPEEEISGLFLKEQA